MVVLADLEIKIARSENFPVLPQVVSQVLKLADDPNATARQFESVIERDPAVTAKILRVANSAYYGLNNVPSVGRALGVLGYNTIRSLVITVAYQQVLSNKSLTTQFDKIEFWRHSLGVATAARILAKMKLPGMADELYSAGMMHDVGLLVLDRFLPSELDRAIQMSREDCAALHQAERVVMGFDHADVGAVLAERWGLSSLLMSAIKNHHQLDPSDPNFETTCFVSAANTLAHQAGLRNNCGDSEVQFCEDAVEAISLPEEQLAVIRTVIAQEVEKASEAFQIK